MGFQYGELTLTWLGHDSFRITDGKIVMYIDPYSIQVGEPKADIIAVTHEHFDHCDPPSIQRLLKPSTLVVAPRVALPCVKKVSQNVAEISPGKTLTFEQIKLTAYPAYNLNKYRDLARGIVFHPKEDGRVAYLIEWGGTRIFHCGDSDFVPEFRNVSADILLVPVSGVYVMTPQEAAEFVNAVRPKVAIPMHYGSIVASRKEAEEFKKLVKPGVEVVILERGI